MMSGSDFPSSVFRWYDGPNVEIERSDMTCKSDMLLDAKNISSCSGGVVGNSCEEIQYFWSVFQSGYGGKRGEPMIFGWYGLGCVVSLGPFAGF